MVNEVVGTGEWEDSEILGETWRSRNVFSYGRNEGGVSGTARPEVFDKLLATTERVVQEIDSVEYGLSDIQGELICCFEPGHDLTLLLDNQQNTTQIPGVRTVGKATSMYLTSSLTCQQH